MYGNYLTFFSSTNSFETTDYKTFTSLLQKYDFFVTVRNPYERVVSEYYCKWGGPETKAVDVAHFNRFIYDRMEEVEGLINGNNKIEGHFTPQYMYMYDRQGKRIVSEQNVVHIEQLAIEFDALMERYGLAIRAKDLGQTNKCTVEKKYVIYSFVLFFPILGSYRKF